MWGKLRGVEDKRGGGEGVSLLHIMVEIHLEIMDIYINITYLQ